MKNIARLSAVPQFGLVIILLAFLAAIIHLHPVNFFGLPSDDAIYFSSARALAEGQGYVLPSVPGTPPATKYPILFPWILSFVWKINPSFPANLPAAIAVVVAFGCWFILSVFLVFPRKTTVEKTEALALTAFCGLHPIVLFYSATLLSDIPFAALSLTALNLAQRYMRRDAKLAGGAVTGLLAGLSILLRVIGVPIAGGILLCALWRRAWRQAAVLAAAAAPFFLRAVWLSILRPAATPPAPFGAFGPGWQQTWIYYTNYAGVWKQNFISLELMARIFVSQVLYFVSDLAGYFIWPLAHMNVVLWLLSTLLTFGILLSGMRRHVMKFGWQPAHFAFALYVGIIFFWQYIVWQRFLMLFLPFLAVWFYMGVKELVSRIWIGRLTRHSWQDKIAAGLLSACIVLLIAGVAWNFVIAGPAQLRTERNRRERAFVEKQEAYDWIKKNTPKDAVVITDDEDAALYLFTGRQAMVVTQFRQAGVYDEQIRRQDLAHMMDVAQAIRARYWVLPNESDLPWRAFDDLKKARLEQLSNVLPELYRTQKGRIKILDLGCVSQPAVPKCQGAAKVLFPEGSGSKYPGI